MINEERIISTLRTCQTWLQDFSDDKEPYNITPAADILTIIYQTLREYDKNNDDKTKMIVEIKEIIQEHGSLSSKDLELDSSPIYNSIGECHTQLIERFDSKGVTIVEYMNDTECGEEDEDYENLEEDLIYEIYIILNQYKVVNEKTMDKIRNENWD